MVTMAVARGKTTSAKTVQASQVFSQAHLRAYFMGIVKLAFATPARMRVAIPHDVLLMIGSLPLSFGCYRCETRVVDHAQFNDRNSQVRPKRFSPQTSMRDNLSRILSCS